MEDIMHESRNAKDFGFDLMVYEDGIDNHSTNFVLDLSKFEGKKLSLREIIMAARVASNGNKDLTISKGKGQSLRLNFLKKL